MRWLISLEMYSRYFTSSQPKQWSKWLTWVEYCYNTSWHTTIGRTPFEVVYGRPPPSFLTYTPGTTKVESVEQDPMARDSVVR